MAIEGDKATHKNLSGTQLACYLAIMAQLETLSHEMDNVSDSSDKDGSDSDDTCDGDFEVNLLCKGIICEAQEDTIDSRVFIITGLPGTGISSLHFAF